MSTTIQMQTRRFSLPAKKFEFAGFAWPKWAWNLPAGTPAKRLAKLRASGETPCGPCYGGQKPETAGKGSGFYLEEGPGDSDHGQFRLRWEYADKIVNLRHRGWYTDDDGIGETLRGIVMRLPHGRGFLVGWTMGENMASEVDGEVWEDREEAARAADGMAERAAERERDYQREQNEIREREEGEAEEAEAAEIDAEMEGATR